jgi:hypothetical protein
VATHPIAVAVEVGVAMVTLIEVDAVVLVEEVAVGAAVEAPPLPILSLHLMDLLQSLYQR